MYLVKILGRENKSDIVTGILDPEKIKFDVKFLTKSIC